MPQIINLTEISRRFRLFKNQDPKAYEQTIRLLDQYVTELTVAVTEAPSDQILVAQGRAQQARKFFQLFTELPPDTSAPQSANHRPAP